MGNALSVSPFYVWDQYRDIFESLGYKSEVINGKMVMTTVTRGVVELQDGDVDDQAVANRIANTKAKVKAYDRFGRVLLKIYGKITMSGHNMIHSINNVAEILNAEEDALDRCVKTGYCDPKKG